MIYVFDGLTSWVGFVQPIHTMSETFFVDLIYRKLKITEVKKRSGHFTFRVWFGDSNDPVIREQVMQETKNLDCLFEWYSTNLLAISAPTHALAVKISGYLFQKAELGLLIYETGQT